MGISRYQFDAHEQAERITRAKQLKQKKEDGASCRTCRHFYQRVLPRTNDPDAMNARCGLKNKPVRYYNICELHEKLVIKIIPISEHLK